MPKLKLLILDANVVIKLHEMGLWAQVAEACDLHLSRIVADDESRYHRADHEEWCQDIDLANDIATNKIAIFDVETAVVDKFKNQFDANYFADLDDGEAESLAFVASQQMDYLISSGDAIVYKVLGNIGRAEQGISLEEILQRCGLGGKTLGWAYTKAFRERYTSEGGRDMIQGRGSKQS